MIEILRQRQMLQNVLTQNRTRPLNISVEPHSASLAFSINPYTAPLVPNGYIEAIRVQDIERGLDFDYDRATGWTGTPEVTVGNNLYISAYAINGGDGGVMQLTIKDDTQAYLAAKSEYVAAGGGLGDETGTINMPDRNYGILIMVEP